MGKGNRIVRLQNRRRDNKQPGVRSQETKGSQGKTQDKIVRRDTVLRQSTRDRKTSGRTGSPAHVESSLFIIVFLPDRPAGKVWISCPGRPDVWM
jgi:hypothetical protein